MQELKSLGAYYTWNNKQGKNSRVYRRIDRVLVNIEWTTNLPASEVYFGIPGLFDHYPAIINWERTH